MIGTVPVYDSVIHYQRDLDTLTAKDFIDVIRLHAEDGVDFVTLHCGITRKTIDQIRKHKRKMNIVSRGGSLVFAWMCMTGEENPFYEYYDEILDICREYDVTISLGDAAVLAALPTQRMSARLRSWCARRTHQTCLGERRSGYG